MQRIKNFLLNNSTGITLGLGLSNLWTWFFFDPDVMFLFVGLILTALGMLEWTAGVEDEA